MTRRRLPLVLAALAVLALVGALVRHGRASSQNTAATTGTTAPTTTAPDPNKPVTLRGALPGALLIADRGNDRMLLVDPARKILWRFPTAADKARGAKVFFDDDTFVEPGGKAIVSNEEDEHTIISVDIATHRETYLYGRPGVKGSAPGLLNTPDDAYVLPDGTMTVADAYNCRILFIRAHRIVRQIGRAGVCVHDPPRTLGAVNGDTPLPDGGVLVSEINGSWVDDFSATGALRWAVQAPVAYPSDPQPLPGGRILLADYSKPGAVVVMSRRGRILWRYGPTSGWGALDHPSLAMPLPNGDIAVNDDYKDRVVIVDPRTNRIVWQYGHAYVKGTGFNLLSIPDGMDYVPLGPHEKPLWQLVHHP
ncbi:MAG: hypothetical protein JO073_02315 [Actinobacteria bacterium]|nr:hypothetical protein [Actinomycetota bacterium]